MDGLPRLYFFTVINGFKQKTSEDFMALDYSILLTAHKR
jgi:hypothetical protein